MKGISCLDGSEIGPGHLNEIKINRTESSSKLNRYNTMSSFSSVLWPSNLVVLIRRET